MATFLEKRQKLRELSPRISSYFPETEEVGDEDESVKNLSYLIADLEKAREMHNTIASGDFDSDYAYDFVSTHPMIWSKWLPAKFMYTWNRVPIVERVSLTRHDPYDEKGKWFMEFGPIDFHTGEELIDMNLTAFGNTLEDLYTQLATNVATNYSWDGEYVAQNIE